MTGRTVKFYRKTGVKKLVDHYMQPKDWERRR